jgi:hypothetical protein
MLKSINKANPREAERLRQGEDEQRKINLLKIMSPIKHKSINKTKVFLRINKEIFQIMILFPLETFKVPKINKIDFCKKDYCSLTRSL